MADETWDLEERYTIGFTENQYHSSAGPSPSPTPGENVLGYTSPALDYAERSNKGAENIFQDHSNNLERQRCRKVQKIQYDILNLVFELTERRKTSTTPQLMRSFNSDIRRSDSRLSHCSDTSLKSSSSLPLIEVQQLPPLSKASFSLPSLTSDTFDYGPQKTNQPVTDLPDKTKKETSEIKFDAYKKTEIDKAVGNGQRFKKKTQVTEIREPMKRYDKAYEEPKMLKVVEEIHKRSKKEKAQNVNGSIVEDHPSSQSQRQYTTGNKWITMTNRIIDRRREIYDEREKPRMYGGRYHTPNVQGNKSSPKLSFCQSSYTERAEKGRIDNIRRRHVTQTKTGPLDFNKLRRQLTTTRSKTVLW